MSTDPRRKSTNKITDPRILDERRNIAMKYLSESIAKKYDKVNKVTADTALMKMAESVANKGRNKSTSQLDSIIRQDFQNLDGKVNQNQHLLNEWGGLAARHGNEEMRYHNQEQNEHNVIRDDVVRIQQIYNKDPQQYNQEFEGVHRGEHERLHHELNKRQTQAVQEINRLKSAPQQVVEVIEKPTYQTGQVTEIGVKKEIRNSNVRENRGNEKVVEQRTYETVTNRRVRRSQGGMTGNQVRYYGDIGIQEQNANVRTNMVNVDVEVIIEKPVIKEKIVEVPYEVIIEKPVENIIEKEVVYEKVIEKPIERVVEREVEEIVNQEKEVIVEKKVFTERVVENPVEKIVHVNKEVIVDKPVEVIEEVERQVMRRVARPRREEIEYKEVVVENPRVVEKIVKKQVQKPYTRYVDVEEIQYVDKEVIKTVDKVIEVDKFVDKEVIERRVIEDVQEHIVRKVVDKPVIKEVLVEEIVEKRVKKPIKRTVRREVEVEVIDEVEEIVETPIYVDKEVEVIVNRPVPVDKHIEVEKVVDVIEEIQIPTKREVIVEKEVEVEQEVVRKVAKYVEKPVQKVVDKIVEKPVTIYVEEEVVRTVQVDKKVPKIVEREVVVEIPVEREVERIVEVEKVVEVPVYVDKVVKKEVPKIVEKIVEVKMPKYMEIKVEREKEKIIEQIVEVETPVYIEQDNEEVVNIMDTGKNERLRKSYRQNVQKISNLEMELRQLEVEAENSRKYRRSYKNTSQNMETTVVGKDANNQLRSELDHLHQQYTLLLEKQQKEQNQESLKNVAPRRSVRKSQVPMEVKKSVMYQETDQKKYYMLNEYNQKVEISHDEYIRMKSSSTNQGRLLESQMVEATRNSGYNTGERIVSSTNRHSGNQYVTRPSGNNQTTTVTYQGGSGYRPSGTNQGTTVTYQGGSGYRPSGTNQGTTVTYQGGSGYRPSGTNQETTVTYQGGNTVVRKSNGYTTTNGAPYRTSYSNQYQTGESTNTGQNYYIMNEKGERVKISAEEYNSLHRKSGIMQ